MVRLVSQSQLVDLSRKLGPAHSQLGTDPSDRPALLDPAGPQIAREIDEAQLRKAGLALRLPGPPPGRWTPGLCGHGRW